jgi:hypothetical protein
MAVLPSRSSCETLVMGPSRPTYSQQSEPMTAYEFATDFAGPIATVIAAVAIAADKLKIDLFEKRYEIYLAAKALLTCAVNYGHERLATEKIVELKIKLDEARVFFPSDIWR